MSPPDPAATPLVRLLRRPESAAALSGWAWTEALAQARAERLAGPLAMRLTAAGLAGALSPAVQRHVLAERRIAERQERMLRWEAGHVARALADVRAPVALLKGAAYVLSGLPNGAGRMSSDIDLLTPRTHLDAVERALLAHGWQHLKMDVYDQRYYRAYMHELPPLRHPTRGTILDVHHAITPLTSRLTVPDRLLWQDAESIAGTPFLRPSPAVLTLHAAIHLFHDGEIAGGFRDLVDIDGLMRHFAGQPGYWEAILDCAQLPHVGRPLYYAQRYARAWFETPVPDRVIERLEACGPPAPLTRVMDRLVDAAFAPTALLDGSRPGGVARWALYIRSHWLRMPLPMLSRHLANKAVRRFRDRFDRRLNRPLHRGIG
ncbi:MAG: hypothetical protein GVY11_08260 [Gammaproteobacteria bacterium]|jgi:hypothetical protein|nr:hypothetical protein [Gammaproteobacteria bacterium]